MATETPEKEPVGYERFPAYGSRVPTLGVERGTILLQA